MLTVDEVLNIKEPASLVHMSISTDNKWLAFCLDEYTKSEQSIGVSMAVKGYSQWVCNLKTNEAFPLTSDANSSWGGVWSPDGKTLAFFADIKGKAQLWLWDSLSGELNVASDKIVRPFFGFEKPIWMKDGRNIIVKTMPDGLFEESNFYNFENDELITNESVSTVKVFKTKEGNGTEGDSDLLQWFNRYRADISVIDVIKRAKTILCRGLKPVGMQLSKDGKTLAFTNCLGEEKRDSQQNIYELWVCRLVMQERLQPKCVATNIRMEYGIGFSWGLDNHSIYYTTSGSLADGGLWVVHTSSFEKSLLYHNKKVHLGHEFEIPKPLANGNVAIVARGKLWHYRSTLNEIEEVVTGKGRIVVAALGIDGEHILVQTHESKAALYVFWKVNLITGEFIKVLEEPFGHLPWFEGGAASNYHNGEAVLAYFIQNADQPPALKVLHLNTNESELVNLTTLNNKQLGSSQILTWSLKGRKMRGALLLPQNIKEPLPVIMRVYGGAMQSDYIRQFGLSSSKYDNHQLLASRGYAVFLPDLPMSRGNEPADEITEAVEAALDVLVQHPSIDPERIGIIGHSFGGYSALVAITRIQRFNAAVVSAGIGNLISFSTHFDAYNPDLNMVYGLVEDGQFNLGKNLWEEKERYIRNSPLFDFHNIKTPVLIIQGTKDHICKGEAGPIFSALNRLDKTAQLVLYDEGHWQGDWKEENIKDYYKRVFDWFKYYL
ncbi:S9 family peptidase [Alkalihalobacillus alcalophilus]|uniref:S9 family peptidase n=1 Tax=Alkalihalobacillus alcalophilus TaxID=1445 RepID=UPI001F4365AF|nr:alpha/beta fold hydrolase [Alkalihalobacillus alcalophilus]